MKKSVGQQSKNSPKEKILSSVTKDNTLFKNHEDKSSPIQKVEVSKDLPAIQRKRKKLARDPYLFFKDAKNPAVSSLKFIFNEKHALGRAMSKWVRRKYN